MHIPLLLFTDSFQNGNNQFGTDGVTKYVSKIVSKLKFDYLNQLFIG